MCIHSHSTPTRKLYTNLNRGQDTRANRTQSVNQLFHGPAPRSPLHRLAVRLRHSRSNTSTEYSLPGATQLSQVRSISRSLPADRVLPAAFRTRHTTSSSTQSHAKQQPTNAPPQTNLTFTRTHTPPDRRTMPINRRHRPASQPHSLRSKTPGGAGTQTRQIGISYTNLKNQPQNPTHRLTRQTTRQNPGTHASSQAVSGKKTPGGAGSAARGRERHCRYAGPGSWVGVEFFICCESQRSAAAPCEDDQWARSLPLRLLSRAHRTRCPWVSPSASCPWANPS